MNEILQKRVEAAARRYCQDKNYMQPLDFKPSLETLTAIDAYIAGATFALRNQWVSVGEALPEIREKDIGNRSWSDWVLVMTHGGSAFIDCYAFHRKEWINNGNDVTHWAPIPSLKGGEE